MYARLSLALCLCAVAALASSASADGFEKPEVIRFGSSTGEMEEALEEYCTSQSTRKIEPPFLPEVEDEQLQIDCEGFDFRGEARQVRQ